MADEHNWIDGAEYPFRPRWLELDDARMHYVDEGSGPTIVFVHGTPTWSFLYRHLIRCLSPRYRCVAPDLPGFGLSEKPSSRSYRPETQARALAELIERLGLSDLTLVVHDFGGPIGLSYAIEQPEKVRALVLFNTWMWSVRDEPRYAQLSRLLSGRIGRFLYLRLNFSQRVMMRMAAGRSTPLSQEAYRHYLRALPTPRDRIATHVYARELIGSSDWFASLWKRRARIVDKPALLLWGMRDPAFGAPVLARWQEALHAAQVVRFEHTGHFVPEAHGSALCPVVEDFLVRVG